MQNTEERTDKNYQGSVLLSDRIKELIVDEPPDAASPYKAGESTFDEDSLERAKYNIRLGKTYYKDGHFSHLDEQNNPLLVIEPYELVFVESHEIFKMPKNIVARYDLRISGCLRGLGLQTGLQLDPTYHGRLFCSLFNFSNKEVSLRYKDQLASIQFIYTTPPTPKTKKYRGRNNLLSLTEVLIEPRRSGLEELRKELREAQDSIHGTINASFQAMAFMIAALAVVVGAVSMLVTSNIYLPLVPVCIASTLVIVVGGLGFWLIKKKMRRK